MLPISDEIQCYLESTCDLIKRQGYHVIVKLRDGNLSTPERGRRLLEAEKLLRKEVDPRIQVFLEPKGDLNILRQRLRGVKLE